MEQRRDGLQRRIDTEADPTRRAMLQRLLDGASSLLGGAVSVPGHRLIRARVKCLT